MFSFLKQPNQTSLVAPQDALSGREAAVFPGEEHLVYGGAFSNFNPNLPTPSGTERIILGMGCFWGAERLFWQLKGVVFTSVGYAGGYTPNPAYEEVCSGQTGHSEVVQVDFDPKRLSLRSVLKVFWEHHDPTQGMRQGNDIGTQYRSVIYWTNDAQREVVKETLSAFEEALQSDVPNQAMSQVVTTEIAKLSQYYYAEPYHQQYLYRNPNGYCGLRGTGVSCSI